MKTSPRGAHAEREGLECCGGCRYCPVYTVEAGGSEAQVLRLQTEGISPKGSCQTLDLGSEGN